ncbi:hypothetical protein [Pedobacter caeni]|nr:hypothetical protein [Pedobacter caeni]
MMVEIGYGLPVFLHPLLVGEGLIGGNNYNIHTPGKNSGLFYPAETGIENLKRFYNFIEKHQSELIERPEEFTIAKARIFDYLVKLDQDYFNLDAWDVFNTNTESHHEQATDLLEDIQNNNLVITKAMDSADPGHLKLSLFSRDSAPGFENFKEFLNHPDFDYGWGVFDHSEATSDVEIFEENGLWGLKDQKGNLIGAVFYFLDFKTSVGNINKCLINNFTSPTSGEIDNVVPSVNIPFIFHTFCFISSPFDF